MASILLVDDDMNLLRGVRRVLRTCPYDLFIASSAEMAIRMLRHGGFDLVVVDQAISDSHGPPLVQWLAIQHPQTACIMLSHPSGEASVADSLPSGDPYRTLTKPCDDVALATAIGQALEIQSVS
ncbi:Alginate biosynthesis transcriptional regulatory protein AlgB [Rubripirellula lacrimiformis]|uniref:Alginate biosynthesis transcriptional regulatory protein AlgB n=1 Tax=Rubripirellula lacrimiformis TaxID=1930273 RepID=A0A517NJB8_9BACT|nr:response regulator [Rubripirellula lacrimiformis]QDT07226.1 Alginate biosynthesis transcriptional regulatory protein AlgB [Rubripirellula lacrimiformis]